MCVRPCSVCSTTYGSPSIRTISGITLLYKVLCACNRPVVVIVFSLLVLLFLSLSYRRVSTYVSLLLNLVLVNE